MKEVVEKYPKRCLVNNNMVDNNIESLTTTTTTTTTEIEHGGNEKRETTELEVGLFVLRKAHLVGFFRRAGVVGEIRKTCLGVNRRIDCLLQFSEFLVPGEGSTKSAVVLHDFSEGLRHAINIERRFQVNGKVAFMRIPPSGSIARHIDIDPADGTLSYSR